MNEIWNRDEITIDDVFVFTVATEIIASDDIEPRSITEYKRRKDWAKG